MIIWNGKDILVMSIMMFLIIITALWSLYKWIISRYREYNSPQEFVKREIRKILKNNPNMKIKYYRDRFCLDEDHFLCFETLEDLESVNIREIDLRFIKKFPDALLSFVLIKDYLEFGDPGALIFEN